MAFRLVSLIRRFIAALLSHVNQEKYVAALLHHCWDIKLLLRCISALSSEVSAFLYELLDALHHTEFRIAAKHVSQNENIHVMGLVLYVTVSLKHEPVQTEKPVQGGRNH